MKIKPIRTENVFLDEVVLRIPYFSLKDVPNLYCARYARLSSEFIFGKKFPVAHAWNLREQKSVISRDFNSYFLKNDKIIPGSIVGMTVPDTQSEISDGEYSHVALYLGTKNRKLMFLEQFDDVIRLINLEKYYQENIIPREILMLK